jgi:hypothetical protein
MEISGTGVSEARMAALEKRLRAMDALVKGLINELIDLKAVATKMSRQTEESSRQDLRRGPVMPGTASTVLAGPPASSLVGSTVIRPRVARQPDLPAAKAEPAMARIMQSDGTMKLELRFGEKNTIDSSAGYTRQSHRS